MPKYFVWRAESFVENQNKNGHNHDYVKRVVRVETTCYKPGNRIKNWKYFPGKTKAELFRFASLHEAQVNFSCKTFAVEIEANQKNKNPRYIPKINKLASPTFIVRILSYLCKLENNQSIKRRGMIP